MREPGDDEILDDEQEQETAPRDGRQLLGWAQRQRPDAKGEILSFGKKRGLASKIVNWTEDQVLAAWAHV
jgi:hypothetical protein